MPEERTKTNRIWSYREGLFFSIVLLILGAGLEWFMGSGGLLSISWPRNLIIAIGYLVLLVGVHISIRNHFIIVWLASIPAAISSIAYFTLLVFFLGFIPQTDDAVPAWLAKLGFSHLAKSWLLVLAQLFLLTSLGLVTLRRLHPFKGKNIGFFLNHAGLWIAILGGTLGSGDFYRLRVPLVENNGFTPMAYNDQNEALHLPFALELKDFEVDEYAPLISILHAGDSIFREELGPFAQANELRAFQYRNWKFTVEQYLPFAKPSEPTGFQESKADGATHAARLVVVNTSVIPADTVRGWISNGSFIYPPRRITLCDSLAIVLQPAAIKAYRSKIRWRRNGMLDSATVEVNKPVKIGAWKIYQVGYNSSLGRWSDQSVLEVITDYWLPVVYLGIAMLLLGSIYLLWQGREFKRKKEAEE